MIFSLKLWLAVFISIDLFSAWWYAKGQDICKVVIFCTAAICGMLSLCRFASGAHLVIIWGLNYR